MSLGYPKCFKKLKALSFKVLVCDWNVRAWTLLEAIRGRRSIYLLCKYNKVLSLRETLEIVHREGSISLSILFLTAQHLLPPPDKDLNETFPSKLYFDMKSKGFVSIEEAGSLLSWRQASRPGDDIVIWSLLVGDEKFNDARAFGEVRLIPYNVLSAPASSSQAHRGSKMFQEWVGLLRIRRWIEPPARHMLLTMAMVPKLE